MARLSSTQLSRALDVAVQLAELRDLEDFPHRSAGLLRSLIACDHSGHNAIDTAKGRATITADPPDVVFDGGPEVLAQFADQNPLVAQAKRGAVGAIRLSDHITTKAFHGTDIYDYVYRIIHIEHQLGIRLPPSFDALAGSEQVIGFSLSRSTRDFSDEDLLLLETVAPLFRATLERLHHLTLLRALQDGEEPSGRLIVLVDSECTVAWATEPARAALGLEPGFSLPATLKQWVLDERRHRPAGSDSPRPIPGHRFRARLVPGAYPGLDAIYVTRDAPPVHTARFQGLGLTSRQGEILELLARGLTNAEIATRMFLSRRTVERHLDGIYRRLGVRNRSEAILVALGADGGRRA
jgi:DNA-binding CsgD family transcriptional regulator